MRCSIVSHTLAAALLSTEQHSSRRNVLEAWLMTSVVVMVPTMGAQALDIDAFMNQQLEQDTKNCNPKLDPKCIPTLTQDEA
jgi:hypothetical protein